jgi:hypothetical protein
MTTARRRAQPEAAMECPEQAIQKAVFSNIRRRGAGPNGFGRRLTCIAEGLNRALAVLETWSLLRGHAITADKLNSQ